MRFSEEMQHNNQREVSNKAHGFGGLFHAGNMNDEIDNSNE